MFSAIFFLNIFLVPLMTYFFFEIGMENFSQDAKSSADTIEGCKNYLTIWLTCIILNAFFNIGMLFCRFVYVRYANGLIMNGKKLFHILVCCVTGAFLFQWLDIQPLQYHFFLKDYPMNLLKGYICTKTMIHGDVHTNIDFSIKPKLIIISCSLLFLLANFYFTKSAHRRKRSHGIPKRRINLIDMKTQNMYAAVIIVNFIIDQTLIGIIQLNYETLGEQNVFKIWWIFHLWELIEVHVIANIVIIKQI